MNETPLPTLAGTEKQIAWAERIRSEAIETLRDLCKRPVIGRELTKRGYKPADLGLLGIKTADEIEAFAERVFCRAASEADASWWIDHRDGPGIDGFEAALNELAPRK